MDARQFLTYVIRPSLDFMGARYSTREAQVLMLATAAQEAHCGHWVQQQDGPAVGAYQMDPDTYALVQRWARKNMRPAPELPELDRLRTDLRAATIASRVLYYAAPAPLPQVQPQAMWEYYKRWYNGAAGAATMQEWLANWTQYVQPNLQLAG